MTNVSLFRGLEPAEVSRLMEIARAERYPAGSEIIREQEPNAALVIIKQGRARVSRLSAGRDVELGEIGEGGFFGEISVFDPGPATATVRAINAVTVLKIEKEELDRLLDQEPELGVRLLRLMTAEICRRIRATDQKLVDTLIWSQQVIGGGVAT